MSVNKFLFVWAGEFVYVGGSAFVYECEIPHLHLPTYNPSQHLVLSLNWPIKSLLLLSLAGPIIPLLRPDAYLSHLHTSDTSVTNFQLCSRVSVFSITNTLPMY